MSPRLSRRRLLAGTAGVAAAGVAGAVGWEAMPWSVRRGLGLLPDPYIPDAAEGRVRLESVTSAAMGTRLALFSSVPAGYGDGAGLPVVVVLHGASASVSDFRDFGLPRFVTAAVDGGAEPFVLAGTDDGPSGWVPVAGSDPFAMLREELPRWLADRGYDATRCALWGWSRGGYGALRFSLQHPEWARAVALFSPAVSSTDPALTDLSALERLRLGVWCGTDDSFYDDVRAVVERLPAAPEPVTYAEGGHTRVFWNDHTVDALGWLGSCLEGR
ncbi:alpha/beta hydrolase [Nocardioides pyridinolyticus]